MQSEGGYKTGVCEESGDPAERHLQCHRCGVGTGCMPPLLSSFPLLNEQKQWLRWCRSCRGPAEWTAQIDEQVQMVASFSNHAKERTLPLIDEDWDWHHKRK